MRTQTRENACLDTVAILYGRGEGDRETETERDRDTERTAWNFCMKSSSLFLQITCFYSHSNLRATQSKLVSIGLS